MKYQSSLVPKLIYVFRINDRAHANCLKVGEATVDSDEPIFELTPGCSVLNKAAKKRINQYTQTAGIAYELLYTELEIFTSGKTIRSFNDKEVHDVLKRSGIRQKCFNLEAKADEWFITDLATVKKAIAAVREGRSSLNASEITHDRSPIVFRPEQAEAIKKTIKQFKKNNQMLWNAKMRFGKTLSALQVVKEIGFGRTLILTHRPVVNASWFEDFEKIFYDRPDFVYGSKTNGESFAGLEKLFSKKNIHYVYFASIQDLRGSERTGGKFDKNDEIFDTGWDLIIVDEAHEGTQTELGKNVMAELTKDETKVLHLSGTPFNLLDNYQEEEIFTWDYVMEQRAKAEWDILHRGDPNPYADLPRLNIFTFNLGDKFAEFKDSELAFNFHEFFRVDDDGEFVHKKSIKAFLDLICRSDKDSNYPFATQEYRDNFRHSFWRIPGVKEGKALSAMLKAHPVFGQFTIVNVAGEGDDDEENEEALRMVRDAISKNDYTITLSCGRLTTGVTVPEWTAVFMLAGSFNTSASSYMQTIFRAQTPARIEGKVKEECFVFDFAPDRTLKVLAETAKISAKVGKTSGTDRQQMGEFLNFCPVISCSGTRMSEYDADRMLGQLKKVYVEHVVQHGFDNNYLYNNDLMMKLTGKDLDAFDGLKRIIGTTRAMAKTGSVDVNNQGFTDEQYEDAEEAEKAKRKKKILTPEEQKLLEEKKKQKKQRDNAISILRGISIRMPLMIYGAELKDENQQITIDNFVDLIDESSWEEFMPRGVTKAIFANFKKYYEPDVFRESGKRIREMARAADALPLEERIERITTIFSYFRNPDKETVLTPWRVVNMHLSDCLGGWTFFDEEFENILEKPRFVNRGEVTSSVFSSNSRVLEINSKSGLYPLYVAYSIYRARLKEELIKPSLESALKIWDQGIAENLFIICKTPMARSITKRTLCGFRKVAIHTHCFDDLISQISHKAASFIEKVKQGKTFWKANGDNNMKFDAIVGNPPYQVMDGGTQSSATPVYNLFVDVAKKIEPRYLSMIMPSRWFGGGKGLDKFREEMLADKSIRILHDFLDAVDCFGNGVEIKGGICYFQWNRDQKGMCSVFTHDNLGMITHERRYLQADESDVFIRYQQGVTIYQKVKNAGGETFDTLVSSQKPFGLRTFVHGQIKSFKGSVKLYENGGIGYIGRNSITKNEQWIDQIKVYISRAYNAGDTYPHQIIGKPIYGESGSCCTETYVVVGPFDTASQARNAIKYISTRFFRHLVMLKKASQQAAAIVYSFVPIQDFSKESDIDWSKSIPEIDQQLYKKYGLTKEETAFIESMIKPME